MKIYKIRTYSIIFFTLLLSISCKSDKNEVKATKKVEVVTQNSNCPDFLFKNKENNLNISFLLDLSDRISDEKYPNPTMSYTDRDLGYIETVSENFIRHIETKKLVLMNDKIQLYFDPPPLDETINEKSKELKRSFNKDNISKEKIDQTKIDYKVLPKDIYTLAKKDGKYVGSDIWRFFKDKVKRYCVEECNRNILVIITDGYMYHEDTKLREENRTSYITPSMIRKFKLTNSKWNETYNKKGFGFIPANSGLDDLEVLVLGVVNQDKKRNPYGKDVIEKYWGDWLKSMGVLKYKIYGADLPSNMENAIQDFIGL
jgi:hypothetical protein